LISLTEINAGYGSLQILYDISFDIEKGELVALLGSNGSGKSTLLKVISAQIRPFKGSIKFEGIELTTLPPHDIVKLGVIQVPEGRQLFPKMTVYENLMVGGSNPRAIQTRQKVLEEVYELFPILRKRRYQMANTLSGGEQQMLAIARGLMANPRVFLLDEPSLGLAPLVVAELFRIIKKLNQDGLTVLLVEQNVRLSLSISKNAHIIERGRVTMSGPSDRLIHEERVKKAFLGL
jgi:branched-chain amino acid transport system ATP-binding protein